MRYDDIGKAICQETRTGSRSIIYPFIHVAQHRPPPGSRKDGDPTFKIYPAWLEFVEYGDGLHSPEELAIHLLPKARSHVSLNPNQKLTSWCNLPILEIHGMITHRAQMQGIPDLLKAGVLNEGNDGEVVFYHAPMFGIGSLCGFWADSIGAAKNFLQS